MAPLKLTMNPDVITSGFLQVEPDPWNGKFTGEELSTIWRACDTVGINRTDAVAALEKIKHTPKERSYSYTNVDCTYELLCIGDSGEKPKPPKGRKPFLKFIQPKRRWA